MSFKLKKIILVQFCFSILFISHSAFADNVKPSAALNVPTSSFAAGSGAGASAPGDASVMDANPAILPALKKQYSVFGGTSWQNYFDLLEAGVFDSTTTPVAMVIRGRQTIPNETSRDRSFKAAFGYQIPAIPNLSVGLSGEYQQLGLTDSWQWQNSNYRMGAGLFYQINTSWQQPFFLGLSTNGLFDKYNASIIDVGVSTVALNQFYTLNADVLFDSKNGFQSVIGGVNILAQTFFELKGSVGYNPKNERFFWGSGIFFKGPLLHLYYTLVKTDSDDTTLRQTAGVELAFSL
ncbi:hypothetical protein [Silvanigrella aquatica]|uniref:Transporter n=1 Tax=Silvanigrella aquatica TaxID=1915309 RepID=A0A1L4D398_9BACT|nr:hypothetical protein [Silvanigrella aquatica]APJ04673.1 hypothetical protein AXG55_12470 [Silvanigrella aquatica]